MTGFMTSIGAFLVAIAVLVAVHEWGHFIVARLMGVKVLRFSIGFGRPLWTRRSGPDQTEYCLSAIPIGGYVKLLDERDCDVPVEDRDRAFNRKSIPARVAILVAGPGLNFLFAILAYWCLFIVGVPGTKPVIGDVEEASIAAEAGLAAGDEIVGVGDRNVATGEGAILAMLQELLSEGDIALRVTDQAGDEHSVILRTAGRASALTEPGRLFTEIGIEMWAPDLPPVIDTLTPDGPAAQAGIVPGDLIMEAGGVVINSWPEWVEFVRARPSEEVQVVVSRDAGPVRLNLTIGTVTEGGETIGRIGASVRIPDDLYNEMRAEQAYNPLAALPVAISKTWEMIGLTVRMVASMFTGDVSVKNISGPINIAQYAGVSASIGFAAFLNFLAIVSISLGILNLLPIPMLDGGQIVYQLIEGATGSPISERFQIIGQQVGIAFLLLLMSFAFYNDLSRIFG
jgi:regulator of sigma E protease